LSRAGSQKGKGQEEPYDEIFVNHGKDYGDLMPIMTRILGKTPVDGTDTL
jgi:hypothetical protein